jgi:hypothetical protein
LNRILHLVLFSALSATGLRGQAPPEIPFESVPNWLKLPEGFNFGEAAGVALNSKGHVFVYNRGAHTALYEFDQTGKFLRGSLRLCPPMWCASIRTTTFGAWTRARIW